MIKPLNDPILEMSLDIEPMDNKKLEEEPIIPKSVPQEEDIFKDGETKENIVVAEDIVKLEVQEKPRGGAKKGGDGKRGKDTKQRKKWVMTDARLASLARAREASVLKRQAVKDEKDRLSKELKDQAVKNITKTVSFKQLQPEPPPKPNVNENERFFNLMDEWDNRKQTRKAKNKKEQSHPASMSIPENSRPKAPENPFDDLFAYKTGKNTFW
jgi:hypothetical protein